MQVAADKMPNSTAFPPHSSGHCGSSSPSTALCSSLRWRRALSRGRRRCRRTPSISSAIRPLTPSASTSSAWPCTSARRRHSSRGSALRPWGYGYLDRPLIKFSSSACRPRQSWAVSGCWRFWQTLQASSFSCDSRTATRTFAPSGSAAATTPSEMWPSSGRQPVSILPGLRGQTLLSPLSWPACSSGRPRRSCVRRGEKCNIVPFPRRAMDYGQWADHPLTIDHC